MAGAQFKQGPQKRLGEDKNDKSDWDVFRSPTGVTFIGARKKVGKKTNLGTRVLATQLEYTYEVVNATIKQIDFARQDLVSHSYKVGPSALKTLPRDIFHKIDALSLRRSRSSTPKILARVHRAGT